MGESNNPCFKPVSPFASWQNTTTTTTTTSPANDFFILPSSGGSCPVISFNVVSNNFEFPPILNNITNTFLCESNLYDPNPCVIDVQKYLKIADIDIDINQCKRYKLVLSNILVPNITTTIAPITTTTPPTTTAAPVA